MGTQLQNILVGQCLVDLCVIASMIRQYVGYWVNGEGINIFNSLMSNGLSIKDTGQWISD